MSVLGKLAVLNTLTLVANVAAFVAYGAEWMTILGVVASATGLAWCLWKVEAGS